MDELALVKAREQQMMEEALGLAPRTLTDANKPQVGKILRSEIFQRLQVGDFSFPLLSSLFVRASCDGYMMNVIIL